jgi:hypothetical protein
MKNFMRKRLYLFVESNACATLCNYFNRALSRKNSLDAAKLRRERGVIA